MTVLDYSVSRRWPRETMFFLALCLTGLAGAYLNLIFGGTDIPVEKVMAALFGEGARFETIVVWKLRLPRLMLAFLAGGALGISGLIMQTILRNPLASPELTGVTMGSALAVVSAIVFLPWISVAYHPVIALAGGFVAGGFVLTVSLSKQAGSLGLILAGVAVTSLCAAGVMVILTGIAPGSQPAYLWLIGSLAGRGDLQLQSMLPWTAVGLLLTVVAHRPLLMLGLGDEAAQAAGVNIPLWRSVLLFAALCLTAGVVAVAGPIAFVGLTAPHLARFVLKNQRSILLATPLMGGGLMIFADLFAKTVAAPREIPLGLFLSLIGAPILIHLIRSSKALSSNSSGAIE